MGRWCVGHDGGMTRVDEHRCRAAYDQVADLYADHIQGTEPEQDIDLAMINHFMSLVPQPRRVLDAGCGAGRLLPYLASRGCLPQGMDLSAEMVRRAVQDYPTFPVRIASLTDSGFPDETFDGILSWYSTIHHPDADLPTVFGEMHRLVVLGGLICLGFQTGYGMREVGQLYRDRGHDIELVRYCRDATNMTRMLEAAGFTVVAVMERAAMGEE